jgi:uncharacterized protein YegP (UPF0339 family)
MARFVIYKDTRNEFRWRFIADNGKIVADSAEGYIAKSDCERGIQIVKQQSPGASVDDQTQPRRF